MTPVQSVPSTAIDTALATGALPGPHTTHPRRRRFDARRAAQVALPSVTGALLVAATATDPGAANDGKEMIEVYAANVDLLQWHMTFLHLSYGLWGLIPLALVALVRGRGRMLMNAAVVLGAVAAISMPSLMLSDMFFAGIANHIDVDTADAIGKEIQSEQWALLTYIPTGLIGMALCLPLAFAGLVRAGRARWWAIVVALLALPAFVVTGATLVGSILACALLVGLSVVVARATRC
jgi:hypothetical protein